MDKAVATLLLTLIACSVLICLTSARNTLCINANGEIKRVFCDGREITRRLPNRMNPNKCDCIMLNICKNITIRAKGYQRKDKGQSQSGIGVCQTVDPTPYRDWVCMKSSLNKAWKRQRMNTKNANHWLPAEKTARAKTCHGKKKLPCKPSMFWNQGVDLSSVDCVLEQCGDECKTCAMSGPGKCDPGMCNYGSGTNYITKETRCNRKCRLDMVAWGQRNSPTATGTGYMRLVDLRSKSKDIIHANKPGAYLALVDMDQCVFEKQYYSDFVEGVENVRDPGLDTSVLKQWIADTTMVNRKAALLQVGGINIFDPLPNNRKFSFAPYANVYELGTPQTLTTFSTSRNCSISATFTGFNYGITTLESFVVNKPGKLLGPGVDC